MFMLCGREYKKTARLRAGGHATNPIANAFRSDMILATNAGGDATISAP